MHAIYVPFAVDIVFTSRRRVLPEGLSVTGLAVRHFTHPIIFMLRYFPQVAEIITKVVSIQKGSGDKKREEPMGSSLRFSESIPLRRYLTLKSVSLLAAPFSTMRVFVDFMKAIAPGWSSVYFFFSMSLMKL